MSYFQKLSLTALLVTAGSISCMAVDNDTIHPFDDVSISTSQKMINIDDPTKIYEELLKREDLSTLLLGIDVDGVITTKPTPSRNETAQARGETVLLINRLMKAGATIVFCSAWYPFHETLRRLWDVGFDESILGNSSEAPQLQCKELTTPLSTIKVQYYQSGHAISVKRSTSKDFYFRHKALAFSLFLSPDELERITEIHFLDDSSHNHTVFRGDIDQLGLYPGKKIYQYLVSVPTEEETPIKTETYVLTDRRKPLSGKKPQLTIDTSHKIKTLTTEQPMSSLLTLDTIDTSTSDIGTEIIRIDTPPIGMSIKDTREDDKYN